MSQQLPALYHAIVVVDVASFTNPARTMIHQRAVQEGLYDVLRRAFVEAGIDLGVCKIADRGDGALILVPPQVARSRLADQLPSRLMAELRRYNAVHSAEAAIQLRVGLHAGDVYQNEYGAVSQAVNLACRLLDASEAKTALTMSTGVLALIASDSFYHEVIHHDPAADPASYRRIAVSVKETSTVGWLRLPDDAAAGAWEAAVTREAATRPESRVIDLFPPAAVQRLHELLVGIAVPHLPILVHRAAGLAAPPAQSAASPWEAFCYLADVNAGADGFPPALAFVELIADHVGGDLRTSLKAWTTEQATRYRLHRELQAWPTADRSRVSVDSRLHLVLVVQPDGIDPHRYLLSYWRQDDPAEWPPARGDTRMVTLDQLERCVDHLVMSAERAWSGCGNSAALEFVLPRELLDLPVHRWHKEHESGDPRPLCLDYPVVVRSLERMRSVHWHRVWHQRWQTLLNDPSVARVYFGHPADTGERHRIDAVLSDPRWVLMVLTTSPHPEPRPGADELAAALRAGLPALVWHPAVSSEALRDVVIRLVEDNGLGDLPSRTQVSRQAVFQALATSFDVNLVRDLVILWDDPHRLVAIHQPPGQQPPGEDTADECEQAS